MVWEAGRVQEDPLTLAQRLAADGDHAGALRLARDLEAEYEQAGDPAATMLVWVRLCLARWLAVQQEPDRPAALAVLDAAELTWRTPVVQDSELVQVLGAELMSLRSFVLRQLGYAADSLAAGERALALFDELAQTAPEVLSAVGHVPILLNRGAALADLGRTAESLPPLAEALETLRASGAAHREVEVELLVLRGTSLTLLTRFDEAEAVELEAIALARTESGRAMRHLLATALSNHATTLIRMRRHDEALVSVGEAMAVLRETDGEPVTAAQRRRWWLPLSTEAEVLLALGRREQAARSARRAEPILREYADQAPLLVAGSLANVCLLLGEAEDDPGYAREALARLTVLNDRFPGRYEYWWRRARDLVTRLGA
ncbi:tetratricopeptide repeat protein [Catellatospora tritici]|uniref:tetratricopeptide repeat protein n=1 Tax=Catellatospora tritici TaxID=2851566 RepID=UPI001C2CE561|nr:tetratricopeptide repeat protein [Catellatospora tritici]MBV1855914.1 tetratricopeptide repeat protein [Catellatospora tritici]